MEPKGPEWLGLGIIQASGLKPRGMKTYSCRWRAWSSWCAEVGVSALAASGDDALLWLRHEKRSRSMVSDTRKAVNLVYQTLGMASPFRERVVMRDVFPDSGRHCPEAEYNWYARDAHRLRVRELPGMVPCERLGCLAWEWPAGGGVPAYCGRGVLLFDGRPRQRGRVQVLGGQWLSWYEASPCGAEGDERMPGALLRTGWAGKKGTEGPDDDPA